jgi:hypothetical protein
VGNGLDKQAPSVSDGNAERKAGRARTQRFAETLQAGAEEKQLGPLFNLISLFPF